MPSNRENERNVKLDLFLWSNLNPKSTGLSFTVWFGVKGHGNHDLQIKVSPKGTTNPSQFVSVAIRPDVRVVKGKLDPSDVKFLRRWVDLNYDTLLKHWEGKIDSPAAIAAMRPIPKDPL